MRTRLLSTIAIAATVLCTSLVDQCFAQAPQSFNYQGALRNAEGDPIPDQPFSIRFSILQGSDSGPVVYQETQQEFTNSLGLFTLRVGEGLPVTGTFAAIDWASSSHYLKVELNAGGSGFTDLGATQLLSVPYALYAASAGGGGGSGPWQASGNHISNTNSGGVGIGTSSVPAESKLVVGAVNTTSEGGQIQINAPGGTYNTAYFLDNYEDRFRIMSGTNTGSLTTRLSIKDGNVGVGTMDPTTKLYVNGTVTISEEVNRVATGAANMVPIAYGAVGLSGSIVSTASSGNVSSTWNSSSSRYEITITGETFNATDYVAVVTSGPVVGIPNPSPAIVNTSSGAGKLIVYAFNGSGSLIQREFSFVVYKP